MQFEKDTLKNDSDNVAEVTSELNQAAEIKTETAPAPENKTEGPELINLPPKKEKGKRGRKPGQKNGMGKGANSLLNQLNDSKGTNNQANEKTPLNGPKIDDSDSFNNSLKEYQSYTPNNLPTETTNPNEFKVIISGFILLQILDAFIPNLLLKIFGYFHKGAKNIQVKKIKLDRDQLKALEPIADKVSEQIFSQMSPLPALVLSMSLMYGGNILTELE